MHCKAKYRENPEELAHGERRGRSILFELAHTVILEKNNWETEGTGIL